MERMQRGNRDVIEGKLQEHFLKLRSVLAKFEADAKNKFEQLMENQNTKI